MDGAGENVGGTPERVKAQDLTGVGLGKVVAPTPYGGSKVHTLRDPVRPDKLWKSSRERAGENTTLGRRSTADVIMSACEEVTLTHAAICGSDDDVRAIKWLGLHIAMLVMTGSNICEGKILDDMKQSGMWRASISTETVLHVTQHLMSVMLAELRSAQLSR